jgi:GT2 family glycosyltransferase
MSISIGVLILNYNNPKMTMECLESIKKQKGDFTLKFLIVDNGSDADNHLQLLQYVREYNDVAVHRISENLGPGPAISVGLSEISKNHSYVLMSHNDTIMFDGALAKLLTSIENNQNFAAIGALQVNFNPPYEIRYSGGRFRNPGLIPSHSKKVSSKFSLNEADWLDFTSLIFNSLHLKKIGFPNKIFDFYWEDSEWSIRAKKHGLKLGVCTEAIVRHKFGATLGTSSNSRFFEKMIKHHFLVIKMHGTKFDLWTAKLYWHYKALQYIFRFQARKAVWIWSSLQAVG